MADDVTIAIGAQDKASAVIDKVASKVGAMPNLLKAGAIGDVVTGIESAFRMLSGAVNAVAQPLIEVSNQIDALTDKARGLGESVGELQAFQFAMEEAGNISAEGSIRALQRIQRIIGDVASGNNDGAASIFESLGLDAQQLSLDRPVAQFNAVREAIASIENVSERAAVAQSLLGKSAGDLLPALIAERSAFEESMKAASDLGLVVDDAGAEGIAQMNDAIGRAQAGLEGLYSQIAVAIAPAVEVVAQAITDFVPPMILLAKVYGPALVEEAALFAGAMVDAAEAAYRFITLDWERFNALAFGDAELRGPKWIASIREARAESKAAAEEQSRLAQAVAAVQRQAQEETNQAQDQAAQRAAEAAQREQERAQEAAARTIEGLQRQIDVEKIGLDAVREREELAKATTDAERDRIQALQTELTLIREQNAARKQAEEDARRAEAEARNEIDRQIDERLRNKEALRRDPGQLQGVESRLLTRGSSSQDSVLQWIKMQYQLLERQLRRQDEIHGTLEEGNSMARNQDTLRVEQIA